MRTPPPETLVILGTDGGARETWHIVREYGPHCRVLFINDIDPITTLLIGADEFTVVKDWNFSTYRSRAGDFTLFTVGMGNPRAKKTMVEKALAAGLRPAPPLISHDTVVRPDVLLRPGSVVHPQCVVASGVRAGEYATLHKAYIGPGAIIGPYATCAPHSTTGAGAMLGEGVYLGGRAAITPGAAIAPWVQIGLNARVSESLSAPHATYIGNPLRRAGA